MPTDLTLEARAKPFIQGAKKSISDVYRVFRDGTITCLVEATPLIMLGAGIKDSEKVKKEFDSLRAQVAQTRTLVEPKFTSSLLQVLDIQRLTIFLPRIKSKNFHCCYISSKVLGCIFMNM